MPPTDENEPSSGATRAPHVALPLLAGLAAVAVAAIVFWSFDNPWTLRGDNKAVMFPLNLEAFRVWMSGRAPQWSAGFWSGIPLLADPTSMSLYWPNFIAFLLTPDPHLRAYDLSTALHSGILVAGVVHLLQILGVRRSCALFGGALAFLAPMHVWYAAAMLTGYAPVVWWPWMLIAAEMLTRPGPRLRYFALGWVALGSCALVYPEFAFYGGVTMSLWLLTRSSDTPLRQRVVSVAILGLGGIALAMPQLLPTIMLLPDTTRGTEGAGSLDFAAVAFHADRLLYPGVSEFIPSFLGVATLILASIGSTARTPRARFFAVMAILAFAISLGPATPIYEFLHSLPVFEVFRQPLKFKLLTELALSVLAAFGLDRLLTASPDTTGTRFTILIATCVLAEQFTYSALRLQSGSNLPGASDESFVELYQRMHDSGVVDRVQSNRATPRPRIVDRVRLRGLPMIEQIPTVGGGPNALLPRRHRMIITALAGGSGPTREEMDYFGARYDLGPSYEMRRSDPCLALGSRRGLYLLQRKNDTCLYDTGHPPLRFFIAAQMHAVSDVDLMTQELGQALRHESTVETSPLTVGVCSYAVSFSSNATVVEHRHELDARVPIVAPADAVDDTAKVFGRARILRYREGDIDLETSANESGFVVARESYFRGWEAVLDGQPAPVYPAAGLFFAVPIDAGKHHVKLLYSAPGFAVGVRIALGWVLAVCLFELARRITASARDHVSPSARSITSSSASG